MLIAWLIIYMHVKDWQVTIVTSGDNFYGLSFIVISSFLYTKCWEFIKGIFRKENQGTAESHVNDRFPVYLFFKIWGVSWIPLLSNLQFIELLPSCPWGLHQSHSAWLWKIPLPLLASPTPFLQHFERKKDEEDMLFDHLDTITEVCSAKNLLRWILPVSNHWNDHQTGNECKLGLFQRDSIDTCWEIIYWTL